MPGGGAYPPVGNGGGSFGSTASRNARQSPPRSSLDDRSIAHTRASHRARARARTHHPPVPRQTTSFSSSVSVPTVPGTCSDRARREIHPDVLDRRRRNPATATVVSVPRRRPRVAATAPIVAVIASVVAVVAPVPGLGRTCRRERVRERRGVRAGRRRARRTHNARFEATANGLRRGGGD